MNATQTPYPYNTQPSPQPPAKKRHILRNIAIGATGTLAVIIVLAGTLGGSPAGTPAPYHTPNVSIPAQATTAPEQVFTDSTGGKCTTSQVVNNYCPGDAPQYTVSQQQAIASAKDYLSAEPGWSYLGLIGQLDSSAVGFSQADATFGVSTVAAAGDTAFWNTQAAASAQSYMQSSPGWSFSGLVGQLDSSAVQFTYAQAVYGAHSVGLS
jgi:hypothetical protein